MTIMDMARAQQFCGSDMSDEEMAFFRKQFNALLFPFYRQFFGWIPLPLALITFTLTTLFAYAIYKGICERRVSRKCYVLLLNRAIGDILCCICFVLCSFYLLSVNGQTFRLVTMRVLGTFVGAAFWSAMVSYVSLSVLKLFAVFKPLTYKKSVTMKRVVYVILLSWLLYLVMFVVTSSTYALSTVPSLRKWSGCMRYICRRTIRKLSDLLLLTTFGFTLIVFSLTLVFVRKARKTGGSLRKKNPRECSSSSSSQNSRFPEWKLALSVGIFVIFNCVYFVGSTLLYKKDPCVTIATQPHYVKCSVLLRILTDTIVGIFTDRKVWFHISRMASSSRSESAIRPKASA